MLSRISGISYSIIIVNNNIVIIIINWPYEPACYNFDCN